MKRGLREHGASILVAALSSAFGVALLDATGMLSTMISRDDAASRSGAMVPALLTATAILFLAIAVYTGAVVTANTFATIIAGRTREIALLRLIGSSARTERRRVSREGLLVGVVGSLVGAVAGTLLAAGGIRLGVATGAVPDLAYAYVSPSIAVPVVGVALTTWLASWIGSRRVLVVTPMQALGAAVETSREEAVSRRGRNGAAVTLIAVGLGLIGIGIWLGQQRPEAVLIGVLGGIVSFTGIVLGAHLVVPPVLRVVGRMLGRGPSARLAAENAVRYPERSVRTTIGLVIGVTLVTMFAVATETWLRIIHEAQRADPQVYAGLDTLLGVLTVVFSVVTGFSALIAAVGMIDNLSLSVLQRTRELGLLRALGFTAAQVRRMVLAESAALSVTAIVIGLVLGTAYGWAGAQTLLGAAQGAGFVMPAIPPLYLGGLVVVAFALAAVAAVAPARRATRVAPVVALAAE